VASPLEAPPQESSSLEPTKVLNNELHEEKSYSKDLKHRTLTKRANLGETHLHVSE
jgi:hypothetical protein